MDINSNIIQYYFFLFSVGIVFSAIFLVFSKKISEKYNFYDNPQNDYLKRHKTPVSFLGGAGILFSFILCLIVVWFLGKTTGLNFKTEQITALFIGSVISWFYGFWDDTYWHNREKITQSAKIFLQIPVAFALALIFYTAGIKYQLFNSALPGIILSACLFLFVSNAVNLQDGLDGLASGIVLISSLGFSIFFALSGHIFLFLVCAAISGAVLAFLFFNWEPASIFLGNNGSYFLGFLMAFFAIMASTPSRFFYSLAPLLLLGAPILNVFYVFSKRWASGKSPFSADRNHIHDDFFGKTKSVKKSVLLIYSIHLICVICGLLLLANFRK